MVGIFDSCSRALRVFAIFAVMLGLNGCASTVQQAIEDTAELSQKCQVIDYSRDALSDSIRASLRIARKECAGYIKNKADAWKASCEKSPGVPDHVNGLQTAVVSMGANVDALESLAKSTRLQCTLRKECATNLATFWVVEAQPKLSEIRRDQGTAVTLLKKSLSGLSKDGRELAHTCLASTDSTQSAYGRALKGLTHLIDKHEDIAGDLLAASLGERFLQSLDRVLSGVEKNLDKADEQLFGLISLGATVTSSKLSGSLRDGIKKLQEQLVKEDSKSGASVNDGHERVVRLNVNTVHLIS